MDLSIFGIGYVGAVSAGCFARDGHKVIAVDTLPKKVQAINKGLSPIVEPGLSEIIADSAADGRLSATTNVKKAVYGSELSLICVGTPSAPNGSLETKYLKDVTEQIGDAIRRKNTYHSVVYRSTMLPGTIRDILIPRLEAASGSRVGTGFGVGYLPEFLRESTAIQDFDNPGATIFGAEDQLTLDRLKQLHPKAAHNAIVLDMGEAEAVKYANNAWHAVKISFANEIGNICNSVGIDGHSVMETLCSDKRLNISPAYLKPGFAFGGSCLPKDLRALRYLARRQEVATPVLDAALEANEVQLSRAYDLVTQLGKRRIGFLGLSFKSGTDDLRESPFVELAERLHGRGYGLRIYDPNIQIPRLTGANLRYVRSRLPHFGSLLCNEIERVLQFAEVLVIGNSALGREALERLDPDVHVVDLVRVYRHMSTKGSYQGLSW
jgi:GDP-mannose 6-dehydrogenase